MSSVEPPVEGVKMAALTETQRRRIRMALLITLQEIGEPDASGLATALSYGVAPVVSALLAVQREQIASVITDTALELVSGSASVGTSLTAAVLDRAANIARTVGA